MLRGRQDVQAKAEEAAAIAGGRGRGVVPPVQGEGGRDSLPRAAGGASRLWADR
jgi:hypothetical protein